MHSYYNGDNILNAVFARVWCTDQHQTLVLRCKDVSDRFMKWKDSYITLSMETLNEETGASHCDTYCWHPATAAVASNTAAESEHSGFVMLLRRDL